MKPVFQTRFGNAPMAPGNCFVACIASIMEFPNMQGMPDEAIIAEQIAESDPTAWAKYPDRVKRNKTWEVLWHRLQVFLLEHYGLFMMDMTNSVFKIDAVPGNKTDEDRFPQLQAFHIVSAQSTRGPFQHSCVGRGGKIIHDPHPENKGLLPESGDNPYEYTFFVCVNPAPEDNVLHDYVRCSKFTPRGFQQCEREAGHDGLCAHRLISERGTLSVMDPLP